VTSRPGYPAHRLRHDRPACGRWMGRLSAGRGVDFRPGRRRPPARGQVGLWVRQRSGWGQVGLLGWCVSVPAGGHVGLRGWMRQRSGREAGTGGFRRWLRQPAAGGLAGLRGWMRPGDQSASCQETRQPSGGCVSFPAGGQVSLRGWMGRFPAGGAGRLSGGGSVGCRPRGTSAFGRWKRWPSATGHVGLPPRKTSDLRQGTRLTPAVHTSAPAGPEVSRAACGISGTAGRGLARRGPMSGRVPGR